MTFKDRFTVTTFSWNCRVLFVHMNFKTRKIIEVVAIADRALELFLCFNIVVVNVHISFDVRIYKTIVRCSFPGTRKDFWSSIITARIRGIGGRTITFIALSWLLFVSSHMPMHVSIRREG